MWENRHGRLKILWVRKVPGKMLAIKMLLVSVTSFEVSPYDFIKTIASNKAVLDLPDLKCKENCNLAVKRLTKVLTDLF